MNRDFVHGYRKPLSALDERFSSPLCKLAQVLQRASLVPRPHPSRGGKGSGYNTTSHSTLEGRNQMP